MTSKIADVNKMFCCVPDCDTDKWEGVDPSITFHEFPAGNPKLASKWIHMINSGVIPKGKPMWFPRGKSVICSKHFQPTDYKKNSLKPNAVPTIFSNNLVGLDKPLLVLKASITEPTKSPSDLKVLSIKPMKSTSVEIKTKSACSSPNSHTLKKTGTTGKSSEIKSILNRASVLFARNMAITKSLEVTRSTSPTNENECSEVEPNISSNSCSLSELNLDQALSLATLQTKHCNLFENLKQETILSRPQTLNRSLLKCNSKTPNFNSSVSRSSSDSVGNKTSIVPKISLLKSNKIQKRKQEGGSNSELIKIGPNKFLKIQRLNAKENTKVQCLNANENTPSSNTVLNSVPNETSSNSQSEDDDDLVIDSYVDDACNSSNDYEPPAAPETDILCNATSTNESGLKTQPVLFTTNMPLGQSLAEPLNSSPTLVKKPSLEQENALLKKVNSTTFISVLNKQPVLLTTNMPLSQSLAKPLNHGNLTPTKTLSLKQENALLNKVQPKTFQSVFNKQPALLTTNTSFSQSLAKPLNHDNLTHTDKLSLKKENALLKKKVEELEKKCSIPIVKSWSNPKKDSLKKKIEVLEKKIREQQRELEEPIQNRLKSIRKESSKGNDYATYLLELINGFGYAHRTPRWSDSTLLKCSQLCRKNAYAYEFFRKSEFIKLPPFTAVEKFLRRNPYLLASKASTSNPDDKSCNVEENSSPSTSGIVYNEPDSLTATKQNHTIHSENHTTSNPETQIQENAPHSESVELTTIPVTVDTSSSELREILLESGEVIQCYSTNICTGEDGYQYYIIPSDKLEEHNASIQNSESNPELSEQTVYVDSSKNVVTTAIEMINQK